MLFCLLSFGYIFAVETTVVYGGKKGWSNIENVDGVVSGTGRFGYDCMELATNSHGIDDYTDLFLDFEGRSIIEKTGKYRVVDNEIITSSSAIMGKAAGLVRRNSEGIKLSGGRDTLFGKEGVMGSFLIEFWLRPSIAENGEIILSWRSSRTVDNYPLYQIINAGFVNNHFQWQFTNVFDGYTKNGGEVTISSYRIVIPDEWSHHELSYDETTGLLEYRINGSLENMVYVTSNGKEIGGSIYTPVLGVEADINICPQYSGYIDDFRIERTSYNANAEEMRYDAYKKDGGRFIMDPIMLSEGTTLDSIEAVVSEPPQTAVVMYVRSDRNHFNWTDSYPEWKPVKPGEEIKGIEGMYFQLAVDLFPDGGGVTTPSVTEIKLHFTELPLPLPPYSLTAEAGDGEVTLTWNQPVDDITGGFYVFYGERPGEYLGREAVQGASPVDVGNVINVKIKGLKNGKIYYFAVSSYSKYGKNIMGELSKEVYARPLKK